MAEESAHTTASRPMTNNDQLATQNPDLLAEIITDTLLKKPANDHEQRLLNLCQALLETGEHDED